MDSILLVDDDLELCQMLSEYLQLEGFAVDQAHDGEQALAKIGQQSYAVVVLDVMMPQLNGFDTLKALRQRDDQQGRTPVLMMSARGEEVDRIVGLEIGADDYLAKPCSPRELVARLRAIIRRVKLERQSQQPDGNDDSLIFAGLKLDPTNQQASLGGQTLMLTQTEFKVLERLLQQPQQLIGKEQLNRYALNRHLGPYDRSLDMHLSNLRRKLAKLDRSIQIQTVRGAGYRLQKVDPNA
jgi:two-component system response regulator CpxR